jgi:tetratricopeptide (TPR) repeat protein
MLFDLKGKRRRVVQGVYLTLAILMGAGLVLFGIGSDVSGGLGDLFREGGGGDNQAEEAARDRIEAAETRLQTDPQNGEALATLVSAHYQLASGDADPETGVYTAEARPELLDAVAAWERYEEAVKKVDPVIARQALQAYDGLGRLEQEAANAAQYWEGAAGAAEAAARAQPRAQNYILLVQYASWAGQTRKADLAADKAIELAPKNQKAQARQAVQQAKAQPPPQQPQGAAGAPPAPAAP